MVSDHTIVGGGGAVLSLLQPSWALLQLHGHYYNQVHFEAPYLVTTTTSELVSTATRIDFLIFFNYDVFQANY